MNLGIIGWDYDEPDSLSLVKYGEELGYDVTLFTLSDVRLKVDGAEQSRVFAGSVPVDQFDAIVSRAQLRDRSWREDFERLMLVHQAFPGLVDPWTIFAVGESKLLAMQRLAAAGDSVELPDLPQRRSGRIVRSAADAWFAERRAIVESAPDDWRGWFRLAQAYDLAGDRRRAREALRTAIEKAD